MEQQPIPEWVHPNNYIEYRELELMTKETIIRKWWTNFDSDCKRYEFATYFFIITTLIFEMLWLLK